MRFLTPKDKKTKFLRINGVVVPVSDERTGGSNEEIGTRARSYNGDYFQDRCGIKKIYNFDVCLMDQESARAFEGLIQGEGDSYKFSTDRYSGKGRAPLTDTFIIDCTETYKFEDPYSAEDSGALTAPTITNISSVDSTDGDGSNWTSTLTTMGDIAGEGLTELTGQPDCVEYQTISFGPTQRADRQVSAGLVPNTDYVFSFYVKASGYVSNGQSCYAYLSGSQLTNPVEITVIPYDNGWVRYSIFFSTNSNTASPITLTLSQTSALTSPTIPINSIAQMYVDAIMLETSRCQVTRYRNIADTDSDNFVDLDLSVLEGKEDFTIAFWHKRRPVIDVLPTLFSIYGQDSEILLTLYHKTLDSSLYLDLARRATITPREEHLVGTTASVLPEETWVHFALVYKYNAGDPVYYVYINGGLVKAISTSEFYSMPTDEFSFLRFYGIDRNSLTNDLQILPYAATEDMIYDWVDWDQAVAYTPDLLVQGNIDTRNSFLASGEITRFEFVSVSIDGEWKNNAIKLSARITEI